MCRISSSVDVKFYAHKSQFPRLFLQYLHEVIAKDYMVRIVCCDCAGELISVKEMEPIFAEYGIVWQLSSAGTPQEMALLKMQ